MDTVYRDLTDCCGCALCASVCPKNAITMQRSNGFLYPVIDQSLCVDCGLCAKKCPFGREKQEDSNCLDAYAVKHTDEQVVQNSSSGGVFTAVSDYILSQGGAVIGADFDEDMNVVHVVANTPEKRDRLRGSKYIQSDTTGVYDAIRHLLNDGVPVLFTGVPCQAAGVREAFPNEEKLYIMDIICHGVPNPLVWKQYVAFIEKKYGKKLTYYSFRDKAISGWRKYSAKLTFEDGSQVAHNDVTGSFIELFRYDVCLRPSCTRCRFTSKQRVGDMTIGDFWGIENVMPEISDNKGISAVMVNTEKGRALFEAIKPHITAYPCSQDDIAARQPNLSRPSQYSNKAAAFQADLAALPFEAVLKKYTRVGLKRRLIDLVKSVLKR